jgi:hypothetical protein
MWTAGANSEVDWDIVVVPEMIWLFFAAGPIIPLLSRLRRKKYESKINF